MKFAFLMNPLETVKAYKDTSYYLMLAAHERGHQVYYVDPGAIQADNRSVYAYATTVEVHSSIETPFTVVDTVLCDLADMDVILIRTDPPFDRAYLYTTLLLDLVSSKTLVVNRPSGIRNWNEKLAAMHYPNLTPETLVSNDKKEILAFSRKKGRLTLKPVDGFGGKGILFLEKDDWDGSAKIDEVTQHGRHWILAQEYLPAATEGDKRVFLVKGEPIGAILRIHADGQELNNLDQGATAFGSELDECDFEICAALKSGLLEQGIFFGGIDVIGGMLIEVNVTSPTGLQELCRFTGKPFHHDMIGELEVMAEAGNMAWSKRM